MKNFVALLALISVLGFYTQPTTLKGYAQSQPDVYIITTTLTGTIDFYEVNLETGEIKAPFPDKVTQFEQSEAHLQYWFSDDNQLFIKTLLQDNAWTIELVDLSEGLLMTFREPTIQNAGLEVVWLGSKAIISHMALGENGQTYALIARKILDSSTLIMTDFPYLMKGMGFGNDSVFFEFMYYEPIAGQSVEFDIVHYYFARDIISYNSGNLTAQYPTLDIADQDWNWDYSEIYGLAFFDSYHDGDDLNGFYVYRDNQSLIPLEQDEVRQCSLYNDCIQWSHDQTKLLIGTSFEKKWLIYDISTMEVIKHLTVDSQGDLYWLDEQTLVYHIRLFGGSQEIRFEYLSENPIIYDPITLEDILILKFVIYA